MKVFYNIYTLTPVKKANRLSSLETKKGVYLRAELNNKVYFSDYFPHESLGDRNIDVFLEEFKFQVHEYDKKVFYHLLKDNSYQKITPKLFYNHKLWSKNEPLDAPVIKYKLNSTDDYGFIEALRGGIYVRLDANGLFTKSSFDEFLKGIPEEKMNLIHYMEDPLKDTDWKDLKLHSARDFIKGNPYQYEIYKPNRSFLPETQHKIIYSSYLGSELGMWHSYSELLESGDLKAIHGIVTQGFYEDQMELFTGNYKEGFIGNSLVVQKLYKKMDNLPWKNLCSM